MINDYAIEEGARCCKGRRGRPVQMESSARDAVILRATAQLLLKIPFDDVTMVAVASASGMSKRTVYERFKDREDLLLRAIGSLTSTIFLPLNDEDMHRPLRERLSLLLRFNAPPGNEKNNLEFLRSLVAKAQTYPALAQKLHDGGRGVLAGFVRTEVRCGIANGEIFLLGADVNMAVDILLDMAFENTLARLLNPNLPVPSDAEIERRREMAITMFLKGCAP